MIKLTNVSKDYILKTGFFKRKTKKVSALTNISLEIKDKECVGLIGLNGAGKSTLLKVILGILQPDIGEAFLFEKNAIDKRQENMKFIGVVFGQRTQLRWDVTPLDAYLLNRSLYGIDHVEFDNILKKYAAILEVDQFWTRPVRTLSLGQKMRADLLAALLHKPKLLILDEPTVGVDFISKKKIIQLINELKKEMTIIFTSHNLNDVYQLCDRFIVLSDGKVIIDSDKDSISHSVGYSSLRFSLATPDINLEGISDVGEISKLNDFEYEISKISKNDLTYCLDKLFKNNQIQLFELKETGLEALLMEFHEESING